MQPYFTAKRIGTEYRIYAKGRLIAATTDLASFERAAALLQRIDPANDGPEVAIINREAAIAADEFMGN